MLPGTERAIVRIAEFMPRLVAALEALAAEQKES